jgi:hypothetical protein
MRNPKVWAGQLEIHFFGLISGLKPIVYELEVGQDGTPVFYHCVMGWEKTENMSDNFFVLL